MSETVQTIIVCALVTAAAAYLFWCLARWVAQIRRAARTGTCGGCSNCGNPPAAQRLVKLEPARPRTPSER